MWTSLSEKERILLLIYFNMSLYATCYQIQRPLEPFMVEHLNIDGNVTYLYSMLQSFFFGLQVIGSIISGLLLDKIEIKYCFILNFTASALSYYILSRSTTMTMLFVSKIPTILQTGFLCAQVAVSHLTEKGAERVDALGKLTMSYTVGSVMGPMLGGILSDYYVAAQLSAAGSILSAILIFMFYPSNDMCYSRPEEDYNDEDASSDATDVSNATTGSTTMQLSLGSSSGREMSNSSVTSMIKIARSVWIYLYTKIITSVANAIVATTFVLVLKDIYLKDTQFIGMCLAVTTGCSATFNGLLLRKVTESFGENINHLILFCIHASIVLCIFMAVFALPPLVKASPYDGIWIYVCITILLGIFQYMLATCSTAASTAKVESNEKGTLVGMEHSAHAAARVFGPGIGALLLTHGGITAVSLGCVAIFSGVAISWAVWADISGYRKSI